MGCIWDAQASNTRATLDKCRSSPVGQMSRNETWGTLGLPW